MNKQIGRIAVSFIVMLVALAVNLSFIQVVGADSIDNRAGNRRNLLREYSRERGAILVAGSPIASSIATNDTLTHLRAYVDGPAYAPVTGFYSFLYGATGIERAENPVLSGSADTLVIDRLQQLFAGRKPRGGAVALTLSPHAQQAAWKALRGRTGAVVAIEPSTGRLLAVVSSPSFDPNTLSSHDAIGIKKAYADYLADPEQPMLNRALARTYPPGSTFKLVTAAAALATGKFTADTVIPGPKTYRLPLTTKDLNNWSKSACGPGGKVTLARALAVSCNTAFAWLGNEVGADALQAQARAFGFDFAAKVPMTAAISRFPGDPDEPQTALSAIGQFDVRATALQMAQVGAGIANGGVVMAPHLVQEVLGPDLSVLTRAKPRALSTAMTAANARTLLEMMEGVVARGTGGNARISGVRVAGKTGTAQTQPGTPPHAWFVGIAPVENPQVAVAVVIENGGGSAEVSGNRLAAPVAQAVMKAVLAKK
ncbi:MAG: serine hydrolase [Actinomycetales bacterium]|nr:serine hydrolase [Actinomycetales bacterium]